MPLFVCDRCDEPCELRTRDPDPTPPPFCPFQQGAISRWRVVLSGRPTRDRPGADLLPGPFCQIPARAIARATASPGRYTIEIGGADRLELEVSRTAFNEAVRAMGDADALA